MSVCIKMIHNYILFFCDCTMYNSLIEEQGRSGILDEIGFVSIERGIRLCLHCTCAGVGPQLVGKR